MVNKNSPWYTEEKIEAKMDPFMDPNDVTKLKCTFVFHNEEQKNFFLSINDKMKFLHENAYELFLDILFPMNNNYVPSELFSMISIIDKEIDTISVDSEIVSNFCRFTGFEQTGFTEFEMNFEEPKNKENLIILNDFIYFLNEKIKINESKDYL